MTIFFCFWLGIPFTKKKTNNRIISVFKMKLIFSKGKFTMRKELWMSSPLWRIERGLSIIYKALFFIINQVKWWKKFYYWELMRSRCFLLIILENRVFGVLDWRIKAFSKIWEKFRRIFAYFLQHRESNLKIKRMEFRGAEIIDEVWIEWSHLIILLSDPLRFFNRPHQVLKSVFILFLWRNLTSLFI